MTLDLNFVTEMHCSDIVIIFISLINIILKYDLYHFCTERFVFVSAIRLHGAVLCPEWNDCRLAHYKARHLSHCCTQVLHVYRSVRDIFVLKVSKLLVDINSHLLTTVH